MWFSHSTQSCFQPRGRDIYIYPYKGIAQMVRNLPTVQETQVQSLGQEDPLEKEILPIPVFLPGEFPGQRGMVGYSLWGCKEPDTTKWLNTYKGIYTNVHRSFAYCSQKLETMPSISHQQIVINPCNGILFSNKKKWAFYISNNIYDSQNDYVEWKKPDKRVHTIWFYLANALGYTSSITVTWIRMVFAWKRETSKKEWLQQVKRTSLGAMDICSLSFFKKCLLEYSWFTMLC